MILLSSADLFQNWGLKRILSGTQSECLTLWIQVRTDNSVGPDLGTNVLQRLSADDKSCRLARYQMLVVWRSLITQIDQNFFRISRLSVPYDAGKSSILFCRLLIFFKINIFKKFFQEYQQSVKQFGPRSGPTCRRAWPASKLFAKVISRRH